MFLIGATGAIGALLYNYSTINNTLRLHKKRSDNKGLPVDLGSKQPFLVWGDPDDLTNDLYNTRNHESPFPSESQYLWTQIGPMGIPEDVIKMNNQLYKTSRRHVFNI